MEKWILRNWLVMAIICLLVGFYISIFEDFVAGKAYLYFILTIVFTIVWLKKKRKYLGNLNFEMPITQGVSEVKFR